MSEDFDKIEARMDRSGIRRVRLPDSPARNDGAVSGDPDVFISDPAFVPTSDNAAVRSVGINAVSGGHNVVAHPLINLSEQVSNFFKSGSPQIWLMAEFFYAHCDRVIYDDMPVKDMPKNMTYFEMRRLRRSQRKHRRFSAAFLKKEREQLAYKRELIRTLQHGRLPDHKFDELEAMLPARVPMPLTEGTEVIVQVDLEAGLIASGFVEAVNLREGTYLVRIKCKGGERSISVEDFNILGEPHLPYQNTAELLAQLVDLRTAAGGNLDQRNRVPPSVSNVDLKICLAGKCKLLEISQPMINERLDSEQEPRQETRRCTLLKSATSANERPLAPVATGPIKWLRLHNAIQENSQRIDKLIEHYNGEAQAKKLASMSEDDIIAHCSSMAQTVIDENNAAPCFQWEDAMQIMKCALTVYAVLAYAEYGHSVARLETMLTTYAQTIRDVTTPEMNYHIDQIITEAQNVLRSVGKPTAAQRPTQ